jgi:hypothetical protein
LNIKSIFYNVLETEEVANGLNVRLEFDRCASRQGKSGWAMTFFKLVIAHDGGDFCCERTTCEK